MNRDYWRICRRIGCIGLIMVGIVYSMNFLVGSGVILAIGDALLSEYERNPSDFW